MSFRERERIILVLLFTGVKVSWDEHLESLTSHSPGVTKLKSISGTHARALSLVSGPVRLRNVLKQPQHSWSPPLGDKKEKWVAVNQKRLTIYFTLKTVWTEEISVNQKHGGNTDIEASSNIQKYNFCRTLFWSLSDIKGFVWPLTPISCVWLFCIREAASVKISSGAYVMIGGTHTLIAWHHLINIPSY